MWEVFGYEKMLDALRSAVRSGTPVYAECGGLMYLARELIVDGETHHMAGLLDIARRFPSFPIVLETYREVLQDYFDLPALRDVLSQIDRRTIRVSEVDLTGPSPFATSLMFDFIASYMYEYDAPLAEKRAAALTLDRSLLQELLGDPQFRDLLDPEVIAEVELELQHLADDRRLAGPDALHDGLRRLGPMTTDAIVARTAEPDRATEWLNELRESRRAITVRFSQTVTIFTTTKSTIFI